MHIWIRYLQQFWGASGNFWQSFWDSFLERFGDDEHVLYIYGRTSYYNFLGYLLVLVMMIYYFNVLRNEYISLFSLLGNWVIFHLIGCHEQAKLAEEIQRYLNKNTNNRLQFWIFIWSQLLKMQCSPTRTSQLNSVDYSL